MINFWGVTHQVKPDLGRKTATPQNRHIGCRFCTLFFNTFLVMVGTPPLILMKVETSPYPTWWKLSERTSSQSPKWDLSCLISLRKQTDFSVFSRNQTTRSFETKNNGGTKDGVVLLANHWEPQQRWMKHGTSILAALHLKRAEKSCKIYIYIYSPQKSNIDTKNCHFLRELHFCPAKLT